MGRHLILLILAGVISSNCLGLSSDTALYDQTLIKIRSVNPEQIAEFKTDPDFDYGGPAKPYRSWFAQGWDKFIRMLGEFFNNPNTGQIFEKLFYGLIIGIIIYFVLKLVNVKVRGVFQGSARSGSPLIFPDHPDLDQLNFEKLIRKALQKKDRREMIRWYYLWALHKLNQGEIIQWEPGKTSGEYLGEIKSPQLKDNFQQLNFLFEYIWYGNFPASQEIGDQTSASFEKLSMLLEKSR